MCCQKSQMPDTGTCICTASSNPPKGTTPSFYLHPDTNAWLNVLNYGIGQAITECLRGKRTSLWYSVVCHIPLRCSSGQELLAGRFFPLGGNRINLSNVCRAQCAGCQLIGAGWSSCHYASGSGRAIVRCFRRNWGPVLWSAFAGSTLVKVTKGWTGRRGGLVGQN